MANWFLHSTENLGSCYRLHVSFSKGLQNVDIEADSQSLVLLINTNASSKRPLCYVLSKIRHLLKEVWGSLRQIFS